MWWSCYVRDRIIALGMRRPGRMAEHDVPMLAPEDFDIEALPQGNTIVSTSCTIGRDVEAQKQMALIFIARAKLCLHINQVLSLQYSIVPNSDSMQGQDPLLMVAPVQELLNDSHWQDEIWRCDKIGK